jgi:hypothetical protein
VTVDLGSTVEIVPYPIGLLSAQAGWGIGGPGPGCFARGRERTRGHAGWPLTGRCLWAAARAQASPPAGPPRTRKAGWAGFKGSTVHRFSIFQKSFAIEFQ